MNNDSTTSNSDLPVQSTGKMASKSGSNRRKSFTKSSHKDYDDRNVSRAGKKPLPEPTHLGHFVLMVVLKVCRSVLFVDTSVKIGIYLIGVMAGSVICDLFVVPKSYLSDKQNFLNQYFVKLGWGWTLTLLVAYICLSSLVYCSGNWAVVRRHIMRMAIATVEWYVCVTAFRHIETTVGMCTSSQHSDRNTCIDSGSGWLGFDISGHVFLLIHNLLTISEEVKTFREWRKLGELLEDGDLPNKRKVTNDDIKQAQSLYKGLTPYIKATFIILALLTVLWEFMLLISVVYRFHTLTQKVTAAFIAVFCWFLNYRVLYRLNSEWFPAYPGECNFNFVKSL